MEYGRALAEVLFGDVNPLGKLHVIFPRTLEGCPTHKIEEFLGRETVKYTGGIYVPYRYFETFEVEPLFCFGHGLSYTDFKYETLSILLKEAAEDVAITVKLKVTNIGDSARSEADQIYVRDMKVSVERPKLELKGFLKVYLEASKTKEVEIK